MNSVKILIITLSIAGSLHISQGQETTTAAEITTEATTINQFEVECSGFWSQWSECFPGSTSDPTSWEDRVFTLTPSQKDATRCTANATVNSVETRSCMPQELPIEDQSALNCTYYGQYNCGNGRCISEFLLCNGDDDCGDNSDEFPSLTSGCEYQDPPLVCGLQQKASTSSIPPQGERFLTGIPGIEEFAGGFDLLSGQFRSNVLSMAGHGSCRKILIAGSTDTYYRLPQNVASLRQMYEIVVDSTKLYESGAGIINATKAGLKYNLDFGGQILDVEGRTGLSQSGTVKDFVTQSLVDDQSKAYASVETSVNTAQITLKEPNSLEVSTDFIKRVMKLPYSSFSNEMYMKFIEDFGTHYVTSAKLGGTYVDTDVYSRCWLDSVNYEVYSPLAWRRTVSDCTRQSFFARLDPDAYTLSSNCMATSSDSSTTLREEAVDYLVYVVGGDIGASSNLKFSFGKANWDPWVQSVINAPTLNMKDFNLEKISSLLSSPSILMNNTRREKVANFLDQAIEMHLKPYDAEKLCEPCNPYSTDITDYDEDGNPVFLQNYGVQYLTGTGGDYKCECVYDIPIKADTCGSAQHLATVFTLVISSVVALLNAAGYH